MPIDLGVPSDRGRVAIVTGGSSGIGRDAALALAARGWKVVAAARDETRLADVVRDGGAAAMLDGAISSVRADVTCERDVAAMVQHTLATYGGIDALVSCAGIGRSPGPAHRMARPVAQLETSEWDLVMRVNLRGTYLANRAVLAPMMTARGGDIVNVSSARGATRGQAFAAPYCASKFAVIGLTQALALEAAAYGIRVQALLPDVTRTPLLQRTTLSGRLGALLPAERVADMIVTMLTLPRDTTLRQPLVASQAQSNIAWRTA